MQVRVNISGLIKLRDRLAQYPRWKLFVALAFLYSWVPVSTLWLLNVRVSGAVGLGVAILYMFTPALAVLTVDKLILPRSLLVTYQIDFRTSRWFFLAWLWPIPFAILTMGIGLLFPGVSFSPEMEGMFARYGKDLGPEQVALMREQIATMPLHPYFLSILSAVFAGVTVNAFAAFGEELGWRGLLYHEFRKLGFWRSAGAVGVIWGLWHAPLILQGYNYPAHPLLGVVMMIAWTILLSPIFAYTREKAGSVIAAAVSHGTLNASAGLGMMLLAGGSELVIGLNGLAGFLALGILNGLVWLVRREEARRAGK